MKYEYPENATQAQKAKIRREARAAVKSANSPSSSSEPKTNFRCTWCNPENSDDVRQTDLPEGLAYQMVQTGYSKHGDVLFYNEETGISEEVGKKWTGWSWLNRPAEEPESEEVEDSEEPAEESAEAEAQPEYTDEQFEQDKSELDNLLNV